MVPLEIPPEEVQRIVKKYHLHPPSPKHESNIIYRDGPAWKKAPLQQGPLTCRRDGWEAEIERFVLPVVPHVGIGPLKLGMSPNEILDAVRGLRTHWDSQGRYRFNVSKNRGQEGLFRYSDSFSLFMVQYIDNRAVEVSVGNALKDCADVMLDKINVFETPAEEVIAALKQSSPCSCDSEDEQLGTEYEFHDMGVRFWREEPFHKKLLSDKAYMKEMKLCINDMFQYLYFQVITVIQ